MSALNGIERLILHFGRFNPRERSKAPVGKKTGWFLEAAVCSSEIEKSCEWDYIVACTAVTIRVQQPRDIHINQSRYQAADTNKHIFTDVTRKNSDTVGNGVSTRSVPRSHKQRTKREERGDSEWSSKTRVEAAWNTSTVVLRVRRRQKGKSRI